MIRTIVLAGCIALTGCASKGLYQWGGYEEQLYATYKDPARVETLRLKLETLLQEAQQSGRRVAPGLYAELGTVYLQGGNRAQAIRYYELERQTWPESNLLMTAMIQNLERLEKGQQGVKP